MLIAIWHKWVERGQWWWLLVLGAALLIDLLAATLIVRAQSSVFDLLLELPYVKEGR